MTYRAILRHGQEILQEAGIEEWEWDARLLLEYACDMPWSAYLMHAEDEATTGQAEVYEDLLTKRAGRIPLQHLTGEQDFCGLTFHVNEHVLTPRQDTEILVEEVLKRSNASMRILDMCTGSGCILISLLHMQKGMRGLGVDLSPEALQVAGENAARLLGNSEEIHIMQEADAQSCTESECVYEFRQSDLFAELKAGEEFDMIVSNPPYIPTAVIEGLMPEVREHEPRMALDGLEDGLHFYRIISQKAPAYLKENGYLLFEIGCEQGEDVSRILKQNDFKDVMIKKDYAGLDRVVLGRKG